MLRHNAQVLGQLFESYLSRILEIGGNAFPAPDAPQVVFEQMLDELATPMPAHAPLPADFSRIDIYGDHD